MTTYYHINDKNKERLQIKHKNENIVTVNRIAQPKFLNVHNEKVFPVWICDINNLREF